MDLERSGDLFDRLSVFDRLAGRFALLTAQFRGTSERDTALPVHPPPVPGPTPDKFTFEFRDPGEHGQDHAS